MTREVTISTIDNPFNPFEDRDSWFMFDMEKGYHSGSRVAKLLELTEDMTEEERSREIERAIDRLIEIDPLDIFIKVTRETKKDREGGPK